MKVLHRLIQAIVIGTMLAGCAPTKPTAEQKARIAAAFKTLADPRSEAVLSCLSLYSAYAPHIQPNYPQEARQYYSLSHSNTITALVLIAEANGKAFDYADMGSAGEVYNLREARWGEFLKTASPQDTLKAIKICNEVLPKITALTADMRQDPKLAPLYRGMDYKLQQRLSGQTR